MIFSLEQRRMEATEWQATIAEATNRHHRKYGRAESATEPLKLQSRPGGGPGSVGLGLSEIDLDWLLGLGRGQVVVVPGLVGVDDAGA
jgi:hypothetical protein